METSTLKFYTLDWICQYKLETDLSVHIWWNFASLNSTQECFKASWNSHKPVHLKAKSSELGTDTPDNEGWLYCLKKGQTRIAKLPYFDWTGYVFIIFVCPFIHVNCCQIHRLYGSDACHCLFYDWKILYHVNYWWHWMKQSFVSVYSVLSFNSFQCLVHIYLDFFVEAVVHSCLVQGTETISYI